MSRAVSPQPPDLSPTSYAVLGLLALRPWTTYELAKQMQRSLHWFWPRAERKLYDEPKLLAERGLASSRSVMTGRRAGTLYEITPAGREALREWVAGTEAAPPSFEMEGMLRLFFAEHGTPEQLLAIVARMGADADASLAELHEVSAPGAAGADAFPDRRAVNALALELVVRLHETVADWSRWATVEVEQWPATRRDRRRVAVGPPERGAQLFDHIHRRTGTEHS